jgi:hypothetical protein
MYTKHQFPLVGAPADAPDVFFGATPYTRALTRRHRKTGSDHPLARTVRTIPPKCTASIFLMQNRD